MSNDIPTYQDWKSKNLTTFMLEVVRKIIHQSLTGSMDFSLLRPSLETNEVQIELPSKKSIHQRSLFGSKRPPVPIPIKLLVLSYDDEEVWTRVNRALIKRGWFWTEDEESDRQVLRAFDLEKDQKEFSERLSKLQKPIGEVVEGEIRFPPPKI